MWNAVAANNMRLRLAPSQRFLALALLLALTVSACQTAPQTLKLGLVAPFEGRWRALGYDAVYAARLAVREINEQGGVGGRPVELVALDDSAEADLARHAAASLVTDPAVVAVVGHGLPEITASALPLYEDNELPLIVLGQAPFQAVDPALLPPDFGARYEAVTPFDEVPGPYAGPTYDAFYLLFKALELAETQGQISRGSVASALHGLQYSGVTGPVFRP